MQQYTISVFIFSKEFLNVYKMFESLGRIIQCTTCNLLYTFSNFTQKKKHINNIIKRIPKQPIVRSQYDRF